MRRLNWREILPHGGGLGRVRGQSSAREVQGMTGHNSENGSRTGALPPRVRPGRCHATASIRMTVRVDTPSALAISDWVSPFLASTRAREGDTLNLPGRRPPHERTSDPLQREHRPSTIGTLFLGSLHRAQESFATAVPSAWRARIRFRTISAMWNRSDATMRPTFSRNRRFRPIRSGFARPHIFRSPASPGARGARR